MSHQLPSVWRIVGELMLPVVVSLGLFFLHARWLFFLSVLVGAPFVVVYGSYWTMRFVHEDRRQQRERARYFDP